MNLTLALLQNAHDFVKPALINNKYKQLNTISTEYSCSLHIYNKCFEKILSAFKDTQIHLRTMDYNRNEKRIQLYIK